MSKKKNKFDLSHLVHQGSVKENEELFFVSDPSKKCRVAKQPNHEFKITVDNRTTTIHSFAIECLGSEPPDHASKWFRNASGRTLYEIWQADLMDEAA